jgi:hypothetical protein
MEHVNISKLRSLQYQIERAHPTIRVDISIQSLIASVEECPQMFVWDDEGIAREKDSSEFFTEEYINSVFNSRIPQEIRQSVIDLLV